MCFLDKHDLAIKINGTSKPSDIGDEAIEYLGLDREAYVTATRPDR